LEKFFIHPKYNSHVSKYVWYGNDVWVISGLYGFPVN
jgi:hypothetical protein